MTRTLTTESGSTYEVDGMKIRRVNPDVPKRADGEWKNLHVALPQQNLVGVRLFIDMQNLAQYGPDDDGNLVNSAFTHRTTTPVVTDSWGEVS